MVKRGDESPSRLLRAKKESTSVPQSPRRQRTKSTERTVDERPLRTPPRSPSRRSPIRKTSPVRSPARVARKSPARKSPARKSPARKSPSRRTSSTATSVQTEEATSSHRPSRARKPAIVDFNSDSEEEIKYEKPKAAVKGRSRNYNTPFEPSKVVEHIPKPDVDTYKMGDLLRRSTRSRSTRSKDVEEERVVHLRDKPTQRLIQYSDDDELLNYPKSASKVERYSESKADKRSASLTTAKSPVDLSVPQEYGGWLGALFMCVAYPVAGIALTAFCSDIQCTYTRWPDWNKYSQWSTYFDLTSAILFLSYFALISLLSVIHVGGQSVYGLANKNGRLHYYINATFINVVVLITVFALEWRYPIVDTILARTMQLLVVSELTALAFALIVYVHSFYVPVSALNPHAVTNSRVYNFWVGREISPRFFTRFDLKVVAHRCFFVGTFLMNVIFIYKDVNIKWGPPTNHTLLSNLTNQIPIAIPIESITYNPTLIVFAVLQLIYAFEHIYYEVALLTTFEYNYEGCGFNEILGVCFGMFLCPAMPAYVYNFHVQLPYWQLTAATILFLIGFVVYRGSNHQKFAFRMNPYDPKLAHLETMPTILGKKLMVSGYWGYVRRPNVVGDIMMSLSWLIFVYDVPIGFGYFLNIVYLVHRTVKDESRCKNRYGSSWDRYCKRIKYVLVPKVY